MRPLLIDERLKGKAAQVVAYARTNLYYPGRSETVPGDDPRHVLSIPVGFRCVFSFTIAGDGKRWRHLSISVPNKDKYPHPIAAFVLADLFGFSGYDTVKLPERPPQDWLLDLNRTEHCIVLAQELPA